MIIIFEGRNMSKNKKEILLQVNTKIDEAKMFECVAIIIETRKARAGTYANREVTLMY